MESTLEFLSGKHESLGKDYRTPDGLDAEGCMNVAFETASKLLGEGKNPYVELVTKNLYEDGRFHNGIFRPPSLNSDISWYKHVVCCEGSEAYNPILGQPVPKSDYTMLAFGEEIEMKIYFTVDAIRYIFSKE